MNSIHPHRMGVTSSQPTNATKKPIDSSARNPLIYIGMTDVPSVLRPVLGGMDRRENVQTESKPCRLLAEMALSAVRKNPQKPAQTRGSRQKKANPEGLVFPLLVDELLNKRVTSREQLSLREIMSDGGLSLKDIGEKMGVSAERVRQIQKKALRKLRNPKNLAILKKAGLVPERSHWRSLPNDD